MSPEVHHHDFVCPPGRGITLCCAVVVAVAHAEDAPHQTEYPSQLRSFNSNDR